MAWFQRDTERKWKCCREGEEHPGGVLDPDIQFNSQVLTGCSGLVPCTSCSTQPRVRTREQYLHHCALTGICSLCLERGKLGTHRTWGDDVKMACHPLIVAISERRVLHSVVPTRALQQQLLLLSEGPLCATLQEMMEMGSSGLSQSFEMGRFSYRSVVSSKLKRPHMLTRGNFSFPQCGFFFSVFCFQ